MKSTQLADAILLSNGAAEAYLGKGNGSSTMKVVFKASQLMQQYQSGQLSGQQPDAEIDYLMDKTNWDGYETAIGESAKHIIAAYIEGPTALWQALQAVMAEETESLQDQEQMQEAE